VRTLALIPAQYHSPIVYPIAGLTHSGNFEGESFRRFLISPQGRAIFAAYGFGTQ
jgi:molybdate transport system substrate-binding protein